MGGSISHDRAELLPLEGTQGVVPTSTVFESAGVAKPLPTRLSVHCDSPCDVTEAEESTDPA